MACLSAEATAVINPSQARAANLHAGALPVHCAVIGGRQAGQHEQSLLLAATLMKHGCDACAGDGVLGACHGRQRPGDAGARKDLDGQADAFRPPLLKSCESAVRLKPFEAPTRRKCDAEVRLNLDT